MTSEIQYHQKHAALDSLADDIKAKHQACDSATEAVINAIKIVFIDRVEVARLVEAAQAQTGSGVAFAKWWRERNMPAGWGEKYLRLGRSATNGMLCDKGQLRLAGILPEAESGNEGQQRTANRWAWTGWCGKIKSSITLDSVRAMGQMDRLTVAKQLEPLVAIYEECKRA